MAELILYYELLLFVNSLTGYQAREELDRSKAEKHSQKRTYDTSNFVSNFIFLGGCKAEGYAIFRSFLITTIFQTVSLRFLARKKKLPPDLVNRQMVM